MHIISKSALIAFSRKYPDAKTSLDSWYKVANSATWRHIDGVRAYYSTADAVGNFTVFNIRGNNYRLITSIDYKKQIIYVKYVLTHSDYDSGFWKNDPYY